MIKLTKEILQDMYYEQKKSINKIAAELDIDRKKVRKLMDDFGIEIKNSKRCMDDRDSATWESGKPSREDLIDLYINQMKTQEEIAQTYNVSRKSIGNLLSEFGIKKSKETVVRERVARNYPSSGAQKNFGANAHTDSANTKREKTNIQKYGCKNVFGNTEIIQKIKNTLKNNPEIVERAAEKRKRFWMSKVGHTNCISYYSSENTEEVLKNKDEFLQYVNSKNLKTVIEIASALNCSDTSVYKALKKFDLYDIIDRSDSSYENELDCFLREIGVKFIRHDRMILSPREIDFYIPENKIGIEFNGTFWHSYKQKPDKKYHFEKSLCAFENGIRLIHIYEYEWKNETKRDIIKSLLKVSLGVAEKRIYARQCEIREISNAEARPFNEKNHLQGHRNAQITYGLFYREELVQLMSFSKNKKYEWEIIRGCPGSNNIVVGGVSKLFSHFIKEKNPSMVFSYCDFNKFDGSGYEKIGMNFIGYTGPDMKWVVGKNVINRNPKKHKEYSKIADDVIYGAGSKKYLKIIEFKRS